MGSGKVCAGCAKTGTLEVIERTPGGYMIHKSFRFTNGDEASLRKAFEKAHQFLMKAEFPDPAV